MTPLAHRIMKQFTLPIKRREAFYNVRHIKEVLSDFHCFECTEAIPLLEELDATMKGRSDEDYDNIYTGRTLFLPAPKTWLEWQTRPTGERRAALLCDRGDGFAEVYMFWPPFYTLVGNVSLTSSRFERYGRERGVGIVVQDNRPVQMNWDGTIHVVGNITATPEWFGEMAQSTITLAHSLLPIINTPRIIGRRQHMPHKTLEKKLTAAMGVGKFPLHAWTEIKLEINKPIEIDDGMPHEAHLTGRRALHFCRAHLRVRNGIIEYVRSHWRGDPAIGIKQSRYKMVA